VCIPLVVSLSAFIVTVSSILRNGRTLYCESGLRTECLIRLETDAVPAGPRSQVVASDEPRNYPELGRLPLASLVVLDQAFAQRINGGLSAVGEMQLAEDVADVGLDRLLSDEQIPRDLPVTQTFGDEP
jgi:hypothetical protein